MKIKRSQLKKIITEMLQTEYENVLTEAFFVGIPLLNSGKMSLSSAISEAEYMQSSDSVIVSSLIEEGLEILDIVGLGKPSNVTQSGNRQLDVLESIYNRIVGGLSAGFRFNSSMRNQAEIWIENASEFVDPETYASDSAPWEVSDSNNDSHGKSEYVYVSPNRRTAGYPDWMK